MIFDSCGKNISGVIYPWDHFPGGAVFLEANFPLGNYVDDKSSERQFSSGAIFTGILSAGSYLCSNCPGAIIRGQSSRGQLSRGNIPQGQLFSEAIVWGTIILGANCPEGSNPRGSHLGSSCPGWNYPGDNFPWGELSGHHLWNTFHNEAVF